MLHTRFTTPAGPVPVAAASAPDAVPFAPAGVGSVGGGRRGRSARDVVDLDGLSWSATGWFGCPVPADGATAMAVSERFRADGACWQACLVPPDGGVGRRWTLVLVADIVGLGWPDNQFSTANDADWGLFDEMFGPWQWRRFVAVDTPAASAAAASVVLPGLLQRPASGARGAVA